jgi:hypothetical protein
MDAARKFAVTITAMALAVSSTAAAQGTQLASNLIPAARSVRSHPTVEDAKRLFDEGRWKDAKRTYDEITQRAIEDNAYEPKAFEGRAQMQYIMDDVRGAARTYAQLAEQASKFGDPETELQAHFKAALLFQEGRDYRNQALHIPRIKALLKSPVIAESTREAIAKRVA